MGGWALSPGCSDGALVKLCREISCFGGKFARGEASPGIKMAQFLQKKTPHKTIVIKDNVDYKRLLIKKTNII